MTAESTLFNRGRLQQRCRWAAWVCVPVLAVLSLTPGDEMVRTGAPELVEHFVAYAGAGGLAAIGYGRRARYLQIGGLLIAYAGVLEIGQNWVPGRHSRMVDFVFSAAGVIAGVIMARFWSRWAEPGR
jgi:VanZ family protein